MDRDRNERAISIRQKRAALQAARMTAQQTLALPTAPFVHVYVAKGEVALEGAELLRKGDAVRVTGAEGQRLTAGVEGAEVLVWEMDAAVTFA